MQYILHIPFNMRNMQRGALCNIISVKPVAAWKTRQLRALLYFGSQNVIYFYFYAVLYVIFSCLTLPRDYFCATKAAKTWGISISPTPLGNDQGPSPWTRFAGAPVKVRAMPGNEIQPVCGQIFIIKLYGGLFTQSWNGNLTTVML